MRPWLAMIRALTARGRRVERVRVVSEPPADYTRYGLWLCQSNVDAGEDIRYLDRVRGSGPPDHDNWLFDSSPLYLVRFDDEDDLLGFERVDPATIVAHCRWRDAAWHQATPYREYLKASGRAIRYPAGA